jgi:hypothetical protein
MIHGKFPCISFGIIQDQCGKISIEDLIPTLKRGLRI